MLDPVLQKPRDLKLLLISQRLQYLEAVMRKYGFRDWDSVLAAIGHGGLKEGQVFNKLVEAYDKDEQEESYR